MEAGHLVWGNEGPLLGGGQEKCSLETQQTLMTAWMQGRMERVGKGDVRGWGEGSAEPGRAQSLPASLCPPPVASECVLPASGCPRYGRIIYLGKEHGRASSQPEVPKGLRWTDSVTSLWRAA